MTDPNTQPSTPAPGGNPPAAPAPEAPPAAAPPATPPEAPPASGQDPAPATPPEQQTLPGTPTEPTTPPAPAAAAPPKGKGGKWVKLPMASFQARVKRDAESQVQTRFGVSLDEAARLIEVGRKAEKGLLDNEAQTNETVQKLQEQLADAQRRLEKQTRALNDASKKHKREVRRLKDRQIEADLKAHAARAGVKDVDYAVHLFARAVAEGKQVKPGEYFAGLKTTHGFLFGPEGAPAEPEAVTPSTAPPASTAPGEVTPDPEDPGTPAPQVNVEDLDQREFNQRTQSKYGFTPGMG